EANLLPSTLKTTLLTTPVCCGKLSPIRCRVGISHNSKFPLFVPVARVLPSGEMAKEENLLGLWIFPRSFGCFLSEVFHKIAIGLSSDAAAKMLPSELISMFPTHGSSDFKGGVSMAPFDKSHRITLRSIVPVAIVLPSGKNAMLENW